MFNKNVFEILRESANAPKYVTPSDNSKVYKAALGVVQIVRTLKTYDENNFKKSLKITDSSIEVDRTAEQSNYLNDIYKDFLSGETNVVQLAEFDILDTVDKENPYNENKINLRNKKFIKRYLELLEDFLKSSNELFKGRPLIKDNHLTNIFSIAVDYDEDNLSGMINLYRLKAEVSTTAPDAIKSESLLLKEDKMPSKERNSLPDVEFGIPSLRKYPLSDKDHVLAAIRMFNHVDKSHEAELAKNILRKMKEYGIPTDVIGKNNRLRNYL